MVITTLANTKIIKVKMYSEGKTGVARIFAPAKKFRNVLFIQLYTDRSLHYDVIKVEFKLLSHYYCV